MILWSFIPLFLVFFVGKSSLLNGDYSLTPHRLRIEHTPMPAFTDDTNLRFSWHLLCSCNNGREKCCRGSTQVAYRIQIHYEDSLVADTGKVISSNHSLVEIPTSAFWKQLQSDTTYISIVTVWGESSPFNSRNISGIFHTALLHASDWKGQWIGGYTQLRSNFTIPSTSEIKIATAYASGLGCFDLTINGKRAGDSALDPGMSTVFTVRMLYRAFNVTSLLTQGSENSIGIRLGMCKYGYLDAFCTGGHGATAKCRAALLQLNIQFKNGSQMDVITNTHSWIGTTSQNPIRYTHLYHGEIFDARLSEPFDQPGFQPSEPTAWGPAIAYNISKDGIGQLSLYSMPPIGVTKTFSPINITEVSANPFSIVSCPSNVFSGLVSQNDILNITCVPGSGTITSIDYASFGTPFYGRFIKASGPDIFWQSKSDNTTKHHVDSCEMCGVNACNGVNSYDTVSTAYLDSLANGEHFSCNMLGNCMDFEDSHCLSKNTLQVLRQKCVGKTSCIVPVTVNVFGGIDPCQGVSKRLFIRGRGCTPAVLPTGRKSLIFDFGQNFAGVVKLKVNGLSRGTVLTLRHSEILHADGTLFNSYCGWPCNVGTMQGNCANQTDQYIAGGGYEEWTPRFTYHGFRFMQLDGYPLPIDPSKLDIAIGLFTHSMVSPTGSVHFDNHSYNILNQIQTMIKYTQLSNLHSIPTDCPQREKRGWMGDAQWTSGEASLNFDMAAFYTNWLRTMGDTQMIECNQVATRAFNIKYFEKGPPWRRPPTYECCSLKHRTFGCDWTGTNFTDIVGSLPDVVPYSRKTYGGWPGDPTWGVAAAIIPWEVYKRTGDTLILQDAYSVSKSFVDFLSRHVDPKSGLVEFGYYGDWCSLEGTSKPAVTGWSHIEGVARMIDMADALGKTNDSAVYKAILATLKKNYHTTYFDTGKHRYGASQTANLLPLYLNITPPGEVSSVVDQLVSDITSHKLGLTSGGVGTRYIFHVLSQYGHGDLALQIATNTKQPSFGFMALQGPAGGGLGTGTIWEHWTGNAHDYGGGSKNHPMFAGGIGVFLYEIAGLSSVYSHNPMRVVFTPGSGIRSVAMSLGEAHVSTMTPVGTACFGWRYITASDTDQNTSSMALMEVNVSVPIGLQHPVEIHLQLPLSFTINQWKMPNSTSCKMVLIDYVYDLKVNIRESDLINNTNLTLPRMSLPGVADINVMLDKENEMLNAIEKKYPVKVVLSLLSGEFSLGLHQLC